MGSSGGSREREDGGDLLLNKNMPRFPFGPGAGSKKKGQAPTSPSSRLVDRIPPRHNRTSPGGVKEISFRRGGKTRRAETGKDRS